MRLTTFVMRQHVFTATSFAIKGEKVKCVASDGSDVTFPVKRLVWFSKLGQNHRVCYLVKTEITGVQVKRVGKERMPGFVDVVLDDGTHLTVNKKRHILHKD